MNLYTHAEANTRKTWLYLAGFLVLVILAGGLFAYALGSPAILWISVFVAVSMSWTSYWYSDKIILAISRAKQVEKRDNPELYRIIENLSITAGLPVPKIFIIQDSQPNAFATGRDKAHAVVAVTTGLLSKLERVELEGVLAHELSHIGNKDMLLSAIVVVLVGLVALASDFFFRITFWGGMGGRDGRKGGHPLFLLLALVAAIIAPLCAQLVRLAISRKRELLADATGALLTRYPEGLARALEKIAQDPNPMRSASDATAHLYIASPFRGKEQRSWLHKLFMTHPPLHERVAALRGLKV